MVTDKIQDLFRYDLLVKEALRSVVRRVLTLAAREGLPGEHHFYITFQTNYPGLRLSTRMRERYPDEMTIVLQHQFWDLAVNEHNFEVGLSFSGVPERLLIPFDAITGFFDPSVQFGLKFEPKETVSAPIHTSPRSVDSLARDEAQNTARNLGQISQDEGAQHVSATLKPQQATVAKIPSAAAPSGSSKSPASDETAIVPPVSKLPRSKSLKAVQPSMGDGSKKKSVKDENALPASDETPALDKKIVSIDAFRKK